MRIKQSICYPLFKPADMELEALFEKASEIGYAAIELWGRGDDFENVMALARKYDLAVASMSGHGSLPDGLNKRSNHERIASELRTSIDIAADHGIPGVICFSGNRQPYTTEIEGIEATADGLRRVAAYAEKRNVNLNLELLNSKVNHPGYQCDHTAWGVAVCERVNSPQVKLLYDIYHMQIMEGDVCQRIVDNIDYIGHFHTGGVPGRHEINETQELNYRKICEVIVSTGFEGFLAQEFIPTAPDPLASLRAAAIICDV